MMAESVGDMDLFESCAAGRLTPERAARLMRLRAEARHFPWMQDIMLAAVLMLPVAALNGWYLLAFPCGVALYCGTSVMMRRRARQRLAHAERGD